MTNEIRRTGNIRTSIGIWISSGMHKTFSIPVIMLPTAKITAYTVDKIALIRS